MLGSEPVQNYDYCPMDFPVHNESLINRINYIKVDFSTQDISLFESEGAILYPIEPAYCDKFLSELNAIEYCRLYDPATSFLIGGLEEFYEGVKTTRTA